MIPDDRLVRNVDHTAGHATLGAESSLRDLLGEPIVQLIVASDDVTRPDLLSLLARIRRARPYDPPLRAKLIEARSGGTKRRSSRWHA